MGDVKTGNTESAVSGSVPEVFQKFVDPATGTVDINKAAEAYRQAEQKVTMTAQEKAEVQRAYEEVSRRFSGQPVTTVGAPVETGRGLTVEELLTDPEGALSKVVDKKMATAAKPIVDRLIEKEHPEVARKSDGTFVDPEFVAGLNRFAGTLPVAIQKSLTEGDYKTAMWTIEQYKAAKKGAATMAKENTSTGTPFSESGKAPSSTEGGPTYKRSEIRKMVRENPKEYAAKVNDIEKAYEEGRVVLD